MTTSNPLVNPEAGWDLIRIQNPFDLKQHTRARLSWQPGQSLAEALPELAADPERYAVVVNGGPVDPADYALTYPGPDACVVIYPIPEGGGGGGKSVLRLISVATLSYFTLGAGAPALFTGSLGGQMLGMATFVAGSMLINRLLPPPVPTSGASEMDSSYGIDGPKNTAAEGIPVPICYGTHRMGGNIIAMHVENVENTQYLYMLLNAGEGPISMISGIHVNDQPIENFSDYETRFLVGLDEQPNMSWFRETINPVNIGRTLNHEEWTYYSTRDEVDKLRFDFLFPLGIYNSDNNSGTPVAHTVDLLIELRRVIAGLGPEDGWVQVCHDSNMIDTWRGRVEIDDERDRIVIHKTYADTTRISKKSTAPYRISFSTVPLYEGLYEVRFKRLFPESSYDSRYDSTRPIKSDRIVDQVQIADVNEIITDRVTYPYTALVGLKIKMSDQLDGIPRVTYLNHGRVIKVWENDTWVIKPSNNPAWIVYDMLTNARYGGGISADRLDLEKFKEWGDYCGEAGLTFDGVIENASNLWDAVQPVLRAGHAMLVQQGTRYTVAVDMPSDPVMMFSVSNIIEGTFETNWLPMSDRATAVEVSYYDAADDYKQRSIKVVDTNYPEGTEERVTTMTLRGITSAQRATEEGIYALNMNRLLAQTCEFEAPIEALACTIGDVVLIQHDQPQWGYAGRTEADSTTSVVKLDRPVPMAPGHDYRLLVHFDALNRATGTIDNVMTGRDYQRLYVSAHTGGRVHRVVVNGQDVEAIRADVGWVDVPLATGALIGQSIELWDTDVLEEREVVNLATEDSDAFDVITVAQPFSAAPGKFKNWMFGETTKVKKPFKIRGIDGSHEYTRRIKAIEYDENVYDLASIEATVPNYSALTTAVSHSTITAVTEELFVAGNTLRTRVTVHFANSYGMYRQSEVKVSTNGGDYVSMGKDRESVTFEADDRAELSIRVIAEDILGARAPEDSAPIELYTVLGKMAPPSDVQNVTVTKAIGGVKLSWDEVADLDLAGYEIREGQYWDSATVVAENHRGTMLFVPKSEPGTFNFLIRAIDTSGNMSEVPGVGEIELVRPEAPTRFDVIQDGGEIVFRWTGAASSESIKYEIREGDSWGNGIKVGFVSGNTHKIGMGSIGSKMFWIKSIDIVGLYSATSRFATLEVAQLNNRNLLYTQDEGEALFPGVKVNLSYSAGQNQIELASGLAYGEYLFEVMLPSKYRARNVLDMRLASISGAVQTVTWSEANFAWGDIEAERAWELQGDIVNVNVEPQIALYNGLDPAAYVDGWRLNGSLVSEFGLSATLSTNLSYQTGRFADGLFVSDVTQAEWAVAIPAEFRARFWLNIVHADLDAVYWIAKGDGIMMQVGYRQRDRSFYLEDSSGHEIVAPLEIEETNRVLVSIVQTASNRRLYVGNLETNTISDASAGLFPLGPMSVMSLSQT